MVSCPRCGNALPGNAKFCAKCGTKTAAPCYNCNKPITGRVIIVDGNPTCEQCNAEMDAVINLAMHNAHREWSACSGFQRKTFPGGGAGGASRGDEERPLPPIPAENTAPAFCSQCGLKRASGAKFCAGCGFKLPA